jgi:hypothetical protein
MIARANSQRKDDDEDNIEDDAEEYAQPFRPNMQPRNAYQDFSLMKFCSGLYQVAMMEKEMLRSPKGEGYLDLIAMTFSFKGLPDDHWVSLREFKHDSDHNLMQLLDLLCAMDTGIISHIIQGNLPFARRRDTELGDLLKAQKAKLRNSPAI